MRPSGALMVIVSVDCVGRVPFRWWERLFEGLGKFSNRAGLVCPFPEPVIREVPGAYYINHSTLVVHPEMQRKMEEVYK